MKRTFCLLVPALSLGIVLLSLCILGFEKSDGAVNSGKLATQLIPQLINYV